MTHGETLGRDAGRVRSWPAERAVDAAVFQSVPGAMAGEVRRDGNAARGQDRQGQAAAILKRLMKPRAGVHLLDPGRTKRHRLSVLKHRKQAEEVAGMIALRAVVLGVNHGFR